MIGVCTGRVIDDGDGLMVHVRFAGRQAQFEMAEDLEPAESILDERDQVLSSRFASASHLRKRLTSVQLAGQISEMIYSLDTTDTKFMPHQFKPLLALLDSPSKGILIADEVGLGKTIEAGLIWTELRFRTNATRMLVVCPAVLCEKWKDELFKRFGTHSQIMSAKELLAHLEHGEAAPKIPAIICSLQGIRPPTDAVDEETTSNSSVVRLARYLNNSSDQILFDMVVIDEAHYLRNHETSSAFLGQLLRPIADYFVLLSATPVNNHSRDLFNLVSLVDPDQFRFEAEFEALLDANRPLVRLSNQLKRPGATFGMVREALHEASQSWMFQESASLSLVLGEIAGRSDQEIISPEGRVEWNQRIDRINLLGQIVVRSRKREVLEKRVERKVSNYSVEMTEAEEDFYARVTEAVISYSLSNNSAQGFLLATPQRQMSSSMFSAANRWLNPGGESSKKESEEFQFEAFGEEDFVEDDSASKYVARSLLGHIDLDALRQTDSKYNLLESMLKEYFRDSPNKKVIVFSYFRDTLDYLKSRLESVGIPSMVVKGGDDKQARINEFRESSRYKVLLASEVAAEGVDLQFMRFLVNYDLPWNPMRVEQRIGRIDRIGQEAESISIANLVYKDTIDNRILVRLFEKLRLFEDSLGCTEEVIANGISLLTRDLLSETMTPEQQEHRIDQARIAMESNRRNMEEIQEHEADFVGLGDFVRDKVSHARDTQRRITDQDLQRHIREFLEDNAPGYTMRMDPGGATGRLRLPPTVTADLQRYRELKQLPRSKLESGNDVEIIIRNHVKNETSSARCELINQYHVLVRMIADIDARSQADDLVISANISSSKLGADVEPGIYAFAAEVWKFEGARREETIRASFISLEHKFSINGELAFDVLNCLRAQAEDWVDVDSSLTDKSIAANRLEQAKTQLLKQHREARISYEAENADRVRIQRRSLDRALARRVNTLEQSIYKVAEERRARYQTMTKGKIKKHKEQHEVAVAKLRNHEQPSASRSGVISGFVRIFR